jgi:hypothetical protein
MDRANLTLKDKESMRDKFQAEYVNSVKAANVVEKEYDSFVDESLHSFAILEIQRLSSIHNNIVNFIKKWSDV